MSGPLAGLKVIDCSRGLAGPRMTGLLADYGADVIRVEPPGGDPWRIELAVPYAVFNRGKRSIELDVGDEKGLATLLALAASSDVFVESFAPGQADRLGLGYSEIHARAPGLVYASISGFGTDGPLRELPAREALVHALVGSMAEQVGHRDGPIFEGLPFASIGASYLAAIGVLGALYRRGIDGAGRHVETSLYDGALAYLSMGWGDTDLSPGGPPKAGSYRLVAASFRCADDEYLGVHSGAVGAFDRLMGVLGLDDRIPSSADGLDMGVPLTPEQKKLLDEEIHSIFASRPRSEWLERLLEADVCVVPHLRPGEVFDEPQPIHNGLCVRVIDPEIGPALQVGPAARFAATPAGPPAPAPSPGQQSEEVLRELQQRPPAQTPSPVPQAGLPLLDGIRILDLGAYYAGPYSSRLLADLGADVIKLEPAVGDPLRRLEHAFRSGQAGKRSIAANLKDPELERARRGLIEWADVVHHNMRPGAAERLGLGYEQVCAIRTDSIYLHSPGWGSSGPNRDRQSFAPMLSGYVGVGFEVAGEFNAPLFPAGNEDSGNGLLGAVAILMGLIHRQRSGEGQLIENPQLHAAMAHMAHIVRRDDGEVLGAGRLDPLQYGVGPLERLYPTRDGWLCLVALRDEEIGALGRVVGLEILGDDRFANPEARRAHAYELEQLLGDAFAERTTAAWQSELHSARVPAAEPIPYNNSAFLRDPRNQRTRRAAECPHETQGHVREIGVLLRVSDSADVPHRLAPELGEHSDEILGELGYSAEQIEKLRDRGSVA